MTKHKILIIKTGYSEILDAEGNSRRVSLGDVLRTTPLLHLYKDDRVTWVADSEAFPLLEGIKYIDRLLPYDFTTAMQLRAERFDTLINLEKVPGICALSNDIQAWRKFGFRFDSEKGSAEAYDRAFEVLAVSSSPKVKKENQRLSQELLFEMVGHKWAGEEYLLGYNPKNHEEYDVGLNMNVGGKWPTKVWQAQKWNKLEEMLAREGLKISRQDKRDKNEANNLGKYIEWINSSKMIISSDSLGLHLGIVLKKKVIGLFGPTPHQEVYFYGRGNSITPEIKDKCIPCFESKCVKKNNSTESSCMESISPERVYKEAKSINELQ